MNKSKFVNPFSQDVIRMSEQFDNATINHNFNELEKQHNQPKGNSFGLR